MTKAIDRILAKGPTNTWGAAAPAVTPRDAEYRSMIDNGGSRPEMGFCIVRADGSIYAFQFFNVANLKIQPLNGLEYLSFTHCGTAVTIQGLRLQALLRAIVRHALIEIHENDGRPDRDDLPLIKRLEVTSPEDNPASGTLRLAKG